MIADIFYIVCTESIQQSVLLCARLHLHGRAPFGWGNCSQFQPKNHSLEWLPLVICYLHNLLCPPEYNPSQSFCSAYLEQSGYLSKVLVRRHFRMRIFQRDFFLVQLEFLRIDESWSTNVSSIFAELNFRCAIYSSRKTYGISLAKKNSIRLQMSKLASITERPATSSATQQQLLSQSDYCQISRRLECITGTNASAKT